MFLYGATYLREGQQYPGDVQGGRQRGVGTGAGVVITLLFARLFI